MLLHCCCCALPSRCISQRFSNSNNSTSTKGSGIGRSLRDVFIFVCLHVIYGIRCVRKHFRRFSLFLQSAHPQQMFGSLIKAVMLLHIDIPLTHANKPNKNQFYHISERIEFGDFASIVLFVVYIRLRMVEEKKKTF